MHHHIVPTLAVCMPTPDPNQPLFLSCIAQVKILVPNSTAGMIIGKAGNYIKQIKEESGSYVQISQKAKDVSLQERCITVIGEKENNRNALLMIIAKVADDPQSGTCLNVSYADVSGPVANYNPTGSPYAQAPATTPTYASTAGINTGISYTLACFTAEYSLSRYTACYSDF